MRVTKDNVLVSYGGNSEEAYEACKPEVLSLSSSTSASLAHWENRILSEVHLIPLSKQKHIALSKNSRSLSPVPKTKVFFSKSETYE